MSDIKNIDTSYYGTQDEWLNLPGISSTAFKVPKWGNLKNAYNTGVLNLNEKINSSLYMFGIKGDSDFLFPCSMTFDSENKYKLHRNNIEVSEISYFGLNSRYIIEKGLVWSDVKENTSTGNENIINGAGLKEEITSDYIDKIFPLVDFNYKNLCSLVVVSLLEIVANRLSVVNVPLGDYIDKPETYGKRPIIAYFHSLYGGTSINRTLSYFYCNINSSFLKNDVIKYDVFSYFPRAGLMGGGMVSRINFTGYSDDTYSNYFYCNPNYWEIKPFVTSQGTYYISVFTGTVNDLLKLSSYVGIAFTPYIDSAKKSELGENLSDENIYVPIIENGILSGKYIRGKKASTLPQMQWENNIREKTGYKGLASIDPTEYTDKISLAKPKIKSEGKFNTLYAMSDSEINSLSNELWGADANKLKQIMDGLMLMGENPLNCIVSLQLFPFDITTQAGTSTQGSITLGATQMTTTGTKVKNLNSVIDIGSVKLRRHFNNFFDYEPYSTAFIYVPYCGTIQLSLNDVMGKTVSARLLIDYITGVCTAVIFADGIPVIYKNGCISQQIAVTGNDMATMSSNAISSSLSLLTNTTNLIAGGKDVSSIINNSANILSSSFDYSARRTIYQTQGANTSQINMCEPQKAYIVLNLPNFDIADEYSAFHGFRCDFYDSVKNLTGYIETDRPNLTGISATEEEKQMLTEIMTGGFYV